MRLVGIDIETHDPYLREKGVSWVYGEGEILCTALYYHDTGEKKIIKGSSTEVKKLLLNNDVTLVGGNIIYDIGWLEYHHKIQGQTKATLVDVLIAEGMIDEYGWHNVDGVAKKYLKRGKKKARLEDWFDERGYRGDFRKYLKDAPWELLKEYVEEDSVIPVEVYLKQLKILKEQELMIPFERDCKMLKVVLKMKQRGMRVDVDAKDERRREFERLLEKKKAKFAKKYGKVNLNSSKQIASLFDAYDIPYKVKVTLKGRGGLTYGWVNLREALQEVSEVVKGFKRKKDKILCMIDKQYAERMENILLKNKFKFTINPSIDKNYLASIEDEYPVAKAIQDIKKIDGILSKLLGEKFDRFIVNGRVHPDFNVALTDDYGTISGRLSSSNPNLQQIPSKGSILGDNGEEISLPAVCRSLFLPEEEHALLKIDYSQIEYRLLVHYAYGIGAKEARERFIDDPTTDYHQFVMDLTGLERKYAKNCNFGIMYGMGLNGMMEAFGWAKSKAEEILLEYNTALPYVSSTMQKVSETAVKRGYILTIGGRRARLRNKDMSYTMLNRLNQGGSADIMKAAMVKAFEEGLDDIIPMHLTVHDELVCSVPRTEEGREAVLRLQEIMETAIELRIPVKADPEIGSNWYAVEENGLEELSTCEC